MTLEELVANLGSDDGKTSEQAEAALLKVDCTGVLRQLIETCASENPVARYRAVWVLGRTKVPEAFETILELCNDDDEGVRYDAVLALGIHGDARALLPLMNMVLLEDVSRPAIDAIARLGDDLFEWVIEFAKHEDANLRRAGLMYLRDRTERPECRAMLENAADDPDPECREIARELLEGSTPN